MAKKKQPERTVPVKSTVEVTPPTSAWLSLFESQRIQLLIVAVASFLLYANSLQNEYALDDEMVLKKNKFVQEGISGIPDILSYDSFYGSIGDARTLPGGRYRPLSLIVYAFEVSLFGNNPFVHHFFNVFFYGCIAVVLLLFLRKFIFQQQPLAALAATLLFVFHPLHTEVVANIKSRDEIFSLLFLLVTLFFLLQYSNAKSKKMYLFLSVLFYFLALFSKENGLTFLAIIPVTLYFFTDKKIRSIITLTLPYVLVALVYITVRVLLIGAKNNEIPEVMDNPYLLATVNQKYATIIFVFLKYLQLLFWPNPLTYDYSYNQIAYRDFSDGWVLLSIAIHLALIAYALNGLKTKSLLSWCILFYLFSMLIVSNIAFNIGAPMAERFLFQASVPFSIAVIVVGRKILQRISVTSSSKIAISTICMLVILSVASFATIRRNPDWKSDQVLFLHDVNISSRSARANTFAGVALVRLCDESKDPKEKRVYAEKALQYLHYSASIKPDFITTLLNMGVAYSRLDSVEKAEATWNKARLTEPNDRNLRSYDQYLAESFYRMGLKEGAEKNYGRAIQFLEKSVKYGPNDAEAWYNLGGAYFTVQNFEEAKTCWEKTLQIKPEHEQARQGLLALEKTKR